MLYHGYFLPMEPFINVLANMLGNLNSWGVHPVARLSSHVNKPPYTLMIFGARFYFFVHERQKTLLCTVVY
jgi:hypothetical protein